jgi:predicted DNA-binding transcriptional regulator AlpA
VNYQLSKHDESPTCSRFPDLEFLTVQELAEILKCSDRHITHLRAIGAVPKPVKLGSLVRWHRKQIEDWVRDGSPQAESGDETVTIRKPVVREKKVKATSVPRRARRKPLKKTRTIHTSTNALASSPRPAAAKVTKPPRKERQNKESPDKPSSPSPSKGIEKDWSPLYVDLGLNPEDFPLLSAKEMLLIAWSAANAFRNWTCGVPMTEKGTNMLKKRLEAFADLVKREPNSYRRIFSPEFQGLAPAEYERMFPASEA